MKTRVTHGLLITIAILIAVAVVLGSVLLRSSATREEIARVTSPDSVFNAVTIRANAGATTSFVYDVYIVPAGGEAEEGHKVFTADKVVGLRVRWGEHGDLEIGYSFALVHHFTNFHQPRIGNTWHSVRIRLLEG